MNPQKFPSQSHFPNIHVWTMDVFDHPDAYSEEEQAAAHFFAEREKAHIRKDIAGKSWERAELNWQGAYGRTIERFG